MQRITATVVALAGLVLIAVPFGLRLFDRADDAEDTTDRFRHMMSEEGLIELRSDFETVKAGGIELIEEAAPRFARDLGMTDEEFAAFLAENFPAVALAIEEIPGVIEFVDPVIGSLEEDAEEYRSADTIPLGDLPITVGPWVFLGLGAGLLILGVVLHRRPGAGPLTVAVVLGLTIAAAPVIVRFPQKAQDGEDVAEVARIGLSPEGADRAEFATVVLDELVIETTTEMLPALSDALGVSETRLAVVLAEEYPAVDQFLAAWDDIGPRAYSLAAKQQASVDDFADADELPFRAIPWLFAGPGFVAAAAAAAALLASRRDPAARAVEVSAPDEARDEELVPR
jgi:hypothetical protein